MNEFSPALLQQKMGVIALLLPRIAIAAAMLPLFAPKLVPPIARNGFCVAVLMSAVAFRDDDSFFKSLGVVEYVLFVGKEAMIGASIGIAFALVLWVGAMVGELIDQQTGLTFTQNLDPVNGQNVSVSAILLQKLWLIVFVAAGGLMLFCETILASYWYWPVEKVVPDLTRVLATMLLGEIAQIFSLTLLLAAPVLLVLFMFDIGLGLLGKAAPPLNLFQLGSSGKPILALIVLLVALPFVLGQGVDILTGVAQAFQVLMEGHR